MKGDISVVCLFLLKKIRMKVHENTSLKKYNTFGLDYIADCMIHITNDEEAISLFIGDKPLNKPLLILGGGSNILFISRYNGTIICPEFGGIKIEEQHPEKVIVSAGAGVIWDNLVEWSVNNGFGGLENLSLIPGNVGAAPVQNIGAYGVEAKDSIVKVKSISTNDGSIGYFSNNECNFSYRNSIFKTENKGKYLITKVYFRLSAKPLLQLEYGSLMDEIKNLGEVSLKNVRKAVINIRKSKLPDPEIFGNAGSFFKNPVVNISKAESLKKNNPLMPIYDDSPDSKKLAAGWLIDQCGWKGKRIGDAGVHEKQALVIINYGHATGKEIFDLSEEIKSSVKRKFDIDLEREVEVIGTI
jgi:UDP-N-acetylmuramate dehydrogenase